MHNVIITVAADDAENFSVQYPYGSTFHKVDTLKPGEKVNLDLLIVPKASVSGGKSYAFHATAAYSTGSKCAPKPHNSRTSFFSLEVAETASSSFVVTTKYLPPLKPTVLRWVTIAFATGDVAVTDISAKMSSSSCSDCKLEYMNQMDHGTVTNGPQN